VTVDPRQAPDLECAPLVGLVEMFAGQVVRQPDQVAVRFSQSHLSYRELDTRSTAVAMALRQRGVGPEVLVALRIEPSLDLIVGLLGILKARGACVPLDGSYPTSRLNFMMGDSRANLILTDAEFITSADMEVLRMEEICQESGEVDFSASSEHDLAYVLYTSGSTGVPKGVAMELGPLARLIRWQLTQDSDLGLATTSQFAPISFDVSFQEIFSTLCGGGTLVVLRPEERRDPARLLRFIMDQSIVRLFLPTAALQGLANIARQSPPPSLRRIYVAGEQLKITAAVREFMSALPRCALHNHYGPTESHVVTSFKLEGDPSQWPALPPIGAPLPHATICLLDECRQPVPMGEIGEIYIGGACLARGYINRPDLTSERFVTITPNQERLYRTGDLGRARDGQVAYCGRVDAQVKVRGYRVELGEIEIELLKFPDVAECAVVTDEDVIGDKRLVAYIVPRGLTPDIDNHPDVPPDENGHREFVPAWQGYLRERLPDFMIPTVWIAMPRLPHTPSGKVDHRSLPQVLAMRPPKFKPLHLPRTSTEKAISEIWCITLQSNLLDVEENFFDLGGTSLLLTHVQSMIRTRLGIEASVAALFEHATVRRFANWVDTTFHGRTPGRVVSDAQVPLDVGRMADEPDGIAIVGMACRFPGAADPTAFWDNLRGGVESITFGEEHMSRGLEDYVSATGTLPDVERFDAEFFGYSRREAELLDPQHRLFLECASEALEDANCDSRSFDGKIGVFGGCGPSTYLLNHLHPAVDWRPDRNFIDCTADLQLLIATDKDFLTSKVSYKLDLRGPSVNINAACATSLFAVHYACKSLNGGECDLALAGGVSIPTPQLCGYAYEPGMVFSSDGHCRAFDEQADGTVFSSGAGVVALKRLSDAMRSGDVIYAVLRGSAVNNDGALKAGMTAPSVEGQARVIAEALRAAGVGPKSISFVEAHGTGTPLGDPIEVAALTKAFGTDGTAWCALGSVKTNVGHMGWASGIAGLIKATLAIHHCQIPPTLHFTRPNPRIGLETTPFFVNSDLRQWPLNRLRRAGVSAFGLGGANAHVILEEAPARPSFDAAAHQWRLVPLSARSHPALLSLAARYRGRVAGDLSMDVGDIALTASVGRHHHRFRRAFVVQDRDELTAELDAATSDANAECLHPSDAKRSDRIVGLFTGQGAEYVGMGRQLYQSEDVFRRALDSSDEILKEYTGSTACELLYDTVGATLGSIAEIQPLTFALQMALVELWKSWGIRFDATLGHSLGEFAAACTAGIFTFEDGLRLVAERGRLLESLSEDAGMAAVFANESDTRAALAHISTSAVVAAVNSPTNTTISGFRSEVHRVCIELEARGWQLRELKVNRAGHSPLMEPILDAFEAAAGKVKLCPPCVDFVSNASGMIVTNEACSPSYWRHHLRETVRFSDGLETLAGLGAAAFIEIGSAPVLLGIAQAVLPDHPAPWLPSLRPGEDDLKTITQSLAQLYIIGCDLDWKAIQNRAGQLVRLPTYPFQRERFWIEAPNQSRARPASPVSPSSGVRDILYQIEWQKIASGDVLPKVPEDPFSGEGDWLIFADTTDIGSALVNEFDSRGWAHIVVTQGKGYEEKDDRHFIIDPTEVDDFRRLMTSIGDRPRTVLFLWALDAPVIDIGARRTGVVDQLRAPLGSAFTLVKVLVEHFDAPPKLWLLTRGSQAILSSDKSVSVAQAPIWGLGRVCELEHPTLSTTCLDLPANESSRLGDLVDIIVGPRLEPEMGLRNGDLYVPRLARSTVATSPLVPNPEATYLVVGGLGGLGLWSAEKLAENGVRHLVLVGRNPASAAAADRIESMRLRGIEINTAQLNVSDHSQVEQLFDVIGECGHPLQGILHCAGVIDDGMITELDWNRIARVLEPKVQGAWNLYSAIASRGLKVELFVLYSSATAVLGNLGQASHASACVFLDALAHHLRATGYACLSINWGAWSGVGYLKEHRALLTAIEGAGMGSIDPDRGAAVIANYLSVSAPQFAVLPNRWSEYLLNTRLTEAPFFSRLATRSKSINPSLLFLSQFIAANQNERSRLVAEHVSATVSHLLGSGFGNDASGIAHDRSLLDCGLDSLSAIRLRNSLQKSLRCTLPPRIAFLHPTVRGLADHLLHEILSTEWIVRTSSEIAATVGTWEGRIAPPQGGDTLSVLSNTGDGLRPLSTQQRRWLSLIREARYGQRVVPIIVHADLVRETFLAALRLIIERHEILRYRYPGISIEVLSTDAVMPGPEIFEDLSSLDLTKRASAISDSVRLSKSQLSDPEARPSWNIRCLKLSKEAFAVLLGLQHIEFDGTSLSVFVDELREAYEALSGGARVQLPVAVQYRQYSAEQAIYRQQGIHEDRSYFEGLFAALRATTALPGHSGFERTRAFESHRYTPSLPLSEWDRMRNAARHLKVSPFSILLAGYARLINEVAGLPEVVIGMITSGRSDTRFATTIGPFTAPFPVPIVVADRSPVELAVQCHRIVGSITARANYAPSDLTGVAPAFAGFPMDTYFTDTAVNFLSYPRERRDTNLRVEVLEILGQVHHPDFSDSDFSELRRIPGLHLVASVSDGALHANYWYHVHRFHESQIAAWAERHRAIINESLDTILGAVWAGA